MSILIKGMEMPKKGEYHMTLYVDSDSAYIDVELFPEDKDKFEIIQVPPHGRLIDADAVERNLVKMQMAQKGVVGHGIRKSRAVVRDMATIIPADNNSN